MYWCATPQTHILEDSALIVQCKLEVRILQGQHYTLDTIHSNLLQYLSHNTELA